MAALRRAMRLSPAEAGALAGAVLALFVARLRFSVRPVRRLLGDLQAGAGQEAGDDAGDDATVPTEADPWLHRLAWSIATAARHVPWRADCLIQVLAADRLLRRRGRIPQFRLGVARSEGGELAAHAWIVCDGVVVTGGDSAQFHVLIGAPGGRGAAGPGSPPPSRPG